MKILMIRPNIGLLQLKNGREVPFDDQGRMEPLQLGILAGLTPLDIEVELYDDRVEDICYDAVVDLVAISVEIFTAKRAYEIADEYRQRGKKVILGGIHVSTLPDEARKHADSILIGDAEPLWLNVLQDFKNDGLKPIYRSYPTKPCSGIVPRRSIYVGKKYLPIYLLQSGRGCPYLCSFCSTGQYFQGELYQRNLSDTISEIKNSNRKLFFFVDDNIIGNNSKAKQLFKALIPLRIRWVGQASLDMVEDLEMMQLIKDSGCLGLIIGFESYTEEGLKAYNKAQNMSRTYGESIAIIRKYQIHIWAAFVLGHDEETKESLMETLEFAIRNKFSFAAFNILMPYPKTELYEQLDRENRLLYDGKWWLSNEYRFNHAAFLPRKMKPEELTVLCNQMRKKYNSFPVILSRIFAKHNLIMFKDWLVILRFIRLFRKEALKKFGMKLGFCRN